MPYHAVYSQKICHIVLAEVKTLRKEEKKLFSQQLKPLQFYSNFIDMFLWFPNTYHSLSGSTHSFKYFEIVLWQF